MRQRMQEGNINTRDYFEKYYASPNWRDGWDGADIRLKECMTFINEEFKRHLDVGCADGMFTRLYLEKYPNTEGHGVDIAQSAVDRAIANCPQGFFEQSDAYELPYLNENFDMVHCAETLEHLEYPEKAIAEAWRVLKPGGAYIVTVPNERAADYVEHLWKWDADGVREMLETRMNMDKLKGFTVIEMKPSVHNGHILYAVCQKSLLSE